MQFFTSSNDIKKWVKSHKSADEAALNIFASGRSREAGATQDNLLGEAQKAGGDLAALLVLAASSRVDRNLFVTDMLAEAKSALDERGRWNRSYDYDGFGTSFLNTSVDIQKLPGAEDGYLLGLNAAYVGKEVEDGLAEALGVEQGLTWKVVTAVLEPEGERFRIDWRITPVYNCLLIYKRIQKRRDTC